MSKNIENNADIKKTAFKFNFDKAGYLLLTVIALILYSNVYRGDLPYNVFSIVNKTSSLGVSNLVMSFVSMDRSFISPVQSFLFTLNYLMFGDNPFTFHITNAVLHIVASCLVFNFFKNFTTKEISLLSAILFSVHPALTETVGAIIGRGEIAGLIFFLLSFKCFLKESKKSFYLSLLFFYLALLSSKIFFFLPFAFILYEYSYKEKIDFKRNAFYFVLPFIYLIHGKLAAFGFLHGNYFIPKEGLIAIILTNVKVFSFYIFKFFAPFDLSYSYSFRPQLSVTGFMSILSIQLFVVVVFLFFLCFFYYKKFAFVFSFPLLSILSLITIFPQVKFLSLSSIYIVSFAFVFILVFLFDWFVNKYSLKFLLIFFIPLTMFFSYTTYERNVILSDNFLLLKDTVSKEPNNHILNYNLGIAFEEKGDFEKALFMYERAININMRFSPAYYNAAAIYVKFRDYPLAFKSLKWAIATGKIDKQSLLNDESFDDLKSKEGFKDILKLFEEGLGH